MRLALSVLCALVFSASAQLRVTNTLYLTWDQPDATPDVVWYVYGSVDVSQPLLSVANLLPTSPIAPQFQTQSVVHVTNADKSTKTITTLSAIVQKPPANSAFAAPSAVAWAPVASFSATNVADMFHPKVLLAPLGPSTFFVVTASNIWGESLFSDPVTVPKPIATGKNLRIGL